MLTTSSKPATPTAIPTTRPTDTPEELDGEGGGDFEPVAGGVNFPLLLG